MEKLKSYEDRAAECERLAEQAGTPEIRLQFLLLAEHWLQMAEAAQEAARN